MNKKTVLRVLTTTLFATLTGAQSYAHEGKKPFGHSSAYFGGEAGWKHTKTKGDQQIKLAGNNEVQKYTISKNFPAGGVFIGYKEIKKNFMHGLEISANVSQSRLRTTITGAPGGPFAGRTSIISLKRYTFGPISLTLGVPVLERFMPYAKVGLSAGYFDAKHLEGSVSKRKHKWKAGLATACGIETAITHKLSTRLEVKHEQFSRYRTRELGTTPAGISIKQVHNPSTLSIQAGVLYHVDPKAVIN